jgi:hypothetical protein
VEKGEVFARCVVVKRVYSLNWILFAGEFCVAFRAQFRFRRNLSSHSPINNMAWIRRNWFYAVALLAAIGHACNWFAVDWLAFALLMTAGFPAWLPTLARYVKALRKTEKGWELELKEDPIGLPAESIQQIVVEAPPQIHAEAAAVRPYNQLSLHARRILKALWHFQLLTFGENDARRWGFGVARGAHDYVGYAIGSKELEWERHVYLDPRGMVYLTNEGVDFCRHNLNAIAEEPLYYNHFAPAPAL